MEGSKVPQSGRKPPTNQLAAAIIATRKDLGLNQTQFSRYLRKNIATIGRWERGEITPHPSVLAQLLLRAPGKFRHVFEDYLDKTYDQVVRETYTSLEVGNNSEDWERDPEKHASEIYNALQERCKWIWAEANNRNTKAADALARIYNQASYEVKKLQEAKRER